MNQDYQDVIDMLKGMTPERCGEIICAHLGIDAEEELWEEESGSIAMAVTAGTEVVYLDMVEDQGGVDIVALGLDGEVDAIVYTPAQAREYVDRLVSRLG